MRILYINELGDIKTKMKIELNKIHDQIDSEKKLVDIFKKNSLLEIELPFDSINVAQSSLDIIQDYLGVSFLAEKIAKHSEIIYSGKVERDKYYLGFLLKIKPLNINELAKLIYYYSKWYSQTNEPTSDDSLEHAEEISEYESNLEKTTFKFPDLIDDYYANLVNAAYYEIVSNYFEDEEESFFKKEYKKYPERKYGFWKSASSNNVNSEYFVSTDSWIIPSNSNIERILELYSGIEQSLEFEHAEIHKYEDKNVIINKSNAVWFSKDNELNRAKNCSSNVLTRYIEKSKKIKTEFFLSQYGDVLLIKESSFYYVFFLYNVKLNFNELNSIRNSLSPIYENIKELIGLSENINLDWSQFDDESFEQLCYDIIYYHPKFDNSTIRKMGKSRSRDGGRDITIWTKATPGHEPKLFIFQCKFYKPNSSLSASKIGDAGNTIMQYGAKGYGVFTTGIIDATLYDMLDGFSNNYGISTRENWSIFELERFISQNKSIIERHFKTKTNTNK